MKRFPELARRGVALALAASMSLSVFMPGALAASVTTAEEHDHDHDHVHLAAENSVDALGNEDLSDEVYNVPGDTAFTAAGTAADPLGGDDEEEIDLDDLTEEQLAEQAVVDEAGHTEHTPDTDAEPVYEQPATCAERGYAIYPCSFELEQEDGTVAHCYHQVVVWLPLADHAWGEWQEPDDADSQKYRVCTVCNAVEYEDGTVVTPGGIPVTDPDHPEWLPGDIGVGGNYDGQIELILNHPHQKNILLETIEATCTEPKKRKWKCWCTTNFWDTQGEKLGHMPEQNAQTHTESATCTKDGVTYKYCGRNNNGKICTYEYPNTRHRLPATGHLSSNGQYWFPNDKATQDKGWIKKEVTCTEDGKLYRDCVNCDAADGYEEKEIVPATGHHTNGVKWTEGDKSDVGWVVNQPYKCADGTKTRKCDDCPKTETVKVPATEAHKYDEFVSTTQPYPCQPGTETWKCTVCGATTTKAAKVAEHSFGLWTDDDVLGCQTQKQTRTCLVCNDQEHRDSSGPIRKHKYTRYVMSTPKRWVEVKVFNLFTIKDEVPVPIVRADCDYGCGNYDELSAYEYPKFAAEAWAATEASESVANTATPLIKEALADTKTAVNNAQNREEAIAALDQIYAVAREKLLAKGTIPVKVDFTISGEYNGKHWSIPLYQDTINVPITEAVVEQALAQLKNVLDDTKNMLNNSFLSEDAVKVAINKIVDTVANDGGLTESIRQLAFYPIYKSINTRKPGIWQNQATDSTPTETGELILRLAESAVTDKEGWQPFLDAIFDDLIDMLIEQLKKDPEYSKYLNNALGDELLEELRPKLREELVNDTTFVDTIRNIAGDAIHNAAYGVKRGWSDARVLAQLREDLMKVQDPVEQEMLDLSATIGDLVESSLAEKINKLLPFGDLTSWIGKWVGAFAKDKAVSEVVGETGKVRQTIEMYIKYITCGKHDPQTRIAQQASCTNNEMTERYCSKCGWVFEKYKTGDAWGHTPVTVKGYDATETADGLTDGVQCAVCSAWIEPQEVIPAEEPQYEKYLVKSAVTADTVKAAGYKNQKKLDEAIDAALTKAGYQTANSERFLAQVQTSIGILSNDRYPEDGVTGMVKLPAGAAGKNCTFYAVQVLTADTHGYSAGDVVVTPLTVTSEGISFKLPVQSVVAIAWKVNE